MNQQSPQQQPSGQSQESLPTPSHPQSQPKKPPYTRKGFWHGLSIKDKVTIIAAIIGAVGFILAAAIPVIISLVKLSPDGLTPPTTITSSPPPNVYPPSGWKMAINDSMKTNSGNWSTYKSPDGSICHFTGDAYQITQETLGYPHYCRMGIEKYTNFAFEVQMMIIKGDQGGIYFRSSDERNISCYYFRINREGGYVFDIYDNNRSKPLVNGTDTTAIHTGFNQPNLIAVVAQGNKFYLYANRQLITVVVDQNNSYSSGYIGLTADALDKPTEVLYSNLKMWNSSSS